MFVEKRSIGIMCAKNGKNTFTSITVIMGKPYLVGGPFSGHGVDCACAAIMSRTSQNAHNDNIADSTRISGQQYFSFINNTRHRKCFAPVQQSQKHFPRQQMLF